LKLRILKGLWACFAEVRILKSLGIRVNAKAKTPAGMLALPILDAILLKDNYTLGDTFCQEERLSGEKRPEKRSFGEKKGRSIHGCSGPLPFAEAGKG
jgi:hypothetical protein